LLENNLKEINEKITNAAIKAGRSPSEITLVAVSKFVAFERMKEIFDLGHMVFGENYIQESLSKHEAFISEGLSQAKLHFIGNIQSNKVKKIISVFDLVHTLDRKKIIDEIARCADLAGVVQKGLLQINISGESSKSGMSEEEVFPLLEHALNKPSLKIEGLMCIGEYFGDGANTENSIAEFEKMRAIKNHCEKEFGISLPELSMGMSGDYELAIEHGATIVRVGSALFGQRVKS